MAMPCPRLRLLAALAAALVAGVLPQASSAAPQPLPPPVPRGRALEALAAHAHVLVGVRPGARAAGLVELAGGRPVSPALDVWRVSGAGARWLVPLLDRRGLVRYAEPDRTRTLLGHLDQGDPLLPKAWQIQRVGADRSEPPGPAVPLTIVDVGLDVTNPDFAGRPDVTLLDEQHVGGFTSADYHGTIVASAAGAAANGVGTVGIQPYAALRVYDLPTLEDSDIIAELDRIAAAGDRTVVNLSIGGPGFSRALYEAVMHVVASGSLVVAAAGNSFLQGDPEIYPADTPHVLTVAATDQANAPAPFSSSSRYVGIAAPGVDIPVQSPDDPAVFALADGTSFAAPLVSAAAVWVWTLRPDLDASQVFELLRRTARDAGPDGWDARTGFGVLDVQAALTAPAPLSDPGEPNDDIDLVNARGVFAAARPPLTAPGRLSARLTASLDAAADPHDVYRVYVPGGRLLRITVTPQGPVDVAVWSPRARTVLRAPAMRLALADRPGSQVERLTYRNTSLSAKTVFLDLYAPRGRGGVTATYSLRVAVR